MSISRAGFLRALIGAPFAAKAIERIITNGVAQPAPVPVRPTTPEPRAWEQDQHRVYAMSGSFVVSGGLGISGYLISG